MHVAVTTGTGKAFSVGADGAELDGDNHPPARELLTGNAIGGEKGLPPLSAHGRSLDDLGNSGRWALRAWQLAKPTIAAINGPAVGGGFGMLLAGESARLGTGFAPLGLTAELGISCASRCALSRSPACARASSSTGRTPPACSPTGSRPASSARSTRARSNYSIVGILAYIPIWFRPGAGRSASDLVDELADFVLSGVAVRDQAGVSDDLGDNGTAAADPARPGRKERGS